MAINVRGIKSKLMSLSAALKTHSTHIYVVYLSHFSLRIRKSILPVTKSSLNHEGAKAARLGSSTVDQVLKYTKYPKYIPSTSTGQVLIFSNST